MTKVYKVSAKRPDTGKFWQYGNMKTNQYGNQVIGMKVTPELLLLLEANKGNWVNFSLFEDDGQRPKPASQPSEVYEDTIPF